MKHLTVDEIISFVSINKLDDESLELAAKVNAHIWECGGCRNRVDAYQTVYDEFVRMGTEAEFKRLAAAAADGVKSEKTEEAKQAEISFDLNIVKNREKKKGVSVLLEEPLDKENDLTKSKGRKSKKQSKSL